MIKEGYAPLAEALLTLETPEEAVRFLKDLCTPAEMRAFEERWLVAQVLNEGEMSYRQINEQTGISTTTIGRVARFLNDEEYKGYKLALERMRNYNVAA